MLTTGQLASHAHRANLVVPVSGQGFQGTSSAATGNATASTDPTGRNESHTHTQEGETDDASNLPPYYALVMIMRCA